VLEELNRDLVAHALTFRPRDRSGGAQSRSRDGSAGAKPQPHPAALRSRAIWTPPILATCGNAFIDAALASIWP